ncbi:MAG: DNA-3-methyladenine glycosylase [Fimbriimonadaceae bacterium]
MASCSDSAILASGVVRRFTSGIAGEGARAPCLTDTALAAQTLLGFVIHHHECSARIVETEAYGASDDPASHAYRGATDRNRVMFGPVGIAYVYFSYGAHWMLNVVAHAEGEAGAVLIRAAEPLTGLEVMTSRRSSTGPANLLSGPGKLCQGLAINRDHYGIDLFAHGDLRLEPGSPPREIIAGVRVGIAHGKGHETPWRFIDADSRRWTSHR